MDRLLYALYCQPLSPVVIAAMSNPLAKRQGTAGTAHCNIAKRALIIQAITLNACNSYRPLTHGMLYRHMSPLIGRNVLLCLQRYKCTFNDFLSCHSFKHIICRFVSAGCTDDQYNVYSMLSECLRVRELPDCFSQSDINDIILYLSTS